VAEHVLVEPKQFEWIDIRNGPVEKPREVWTAIDWESAVRLPIVWFKAGYHADVLVNKVIDQGLKGDLILNSLDFSSIVDLSEIVPQQIDAVSTCCS